MSILWVVSVERQAEEKSGTFFVIAFDPYPSLMTSNNFL
jgi:hypothetical protein